MLAGLYFAAPENLSHFACILNRMTYSDPYTTLRALLIATAPHSGTTYLSKAAQALAEQLGADFVFISRLQEDRSNEVTILAATRDGIEIKGWDFSLAGTPCELIYQDEQVKNEWNEMRIGRKVSIAENVWRQFDSLQSTRYEAFIGVPLWNDQQQMIGHVALFFNHKLQDEQQRKIFTELVELYAIRVQSEMMRLFSEQAQQKALHELKLANKQLLHDSITDALTQLHNRRYFSRRIQQAHERFRRSADPYALLLLDVDKFKSINDQYGHDVGDKVLKSIGSTLVKNTRDKIELVFRIGGEEFAILCHGAFSATQLTGLGERMMQTLKNENFSAKRKKFQVTVSIGAALPKKEDSNWNDIFVRADTAMYAAKKAGGDRMVIDGQC